MRIWIAATALAFGLTGSAEAATLFASSAIAPGGHIKAFETPSLTATQSFIPFAGGVGASVGAARNADGREVLVVGAAAGGHVKVVDVESGATLHSFFAFPGLLGGVHVAAGDVNGDGLADIVVGAGSGASGGHVKVFDGATGGELSSFLAFPGLGGGVTVAAGDLNGDGRADIVVGSSAVGHVKVFDGSTGATLQSFFAFPGFVGGVSVATGRNALGDTLIVGALSGGGQVSVFDPVSGALQDSFFAFGAGYLGGVSVGGGSFGGLDSILVGALDGAGGHVKVFGADEPADALASFLAFPGGGGVEVAGLFDAAAVPEPATWALMILGFGAAGGALRRDRRGKTSEPASKS